MKFIQLVNGITHAIVDDEDFDKLSKERWYFSGNRAVTDFGNRRVAMTDLILGIKTGYYIDHINGNTLDNRKENLRHATNSQNQANRGLSKHNTSGYKGVRWHKGGRKWIAEIMKDRKHIYLGLFVELEDAIIAYNKAAIEHFGEFAKLNALPSENIIQMTHKT